MQLCSYKYIAQNHANKHPRWVHTQYYRTTLLSENEIFTLKFYPAVFVSLVVARYQLDGILLIFHDSESLLSIFEHQSNTNFLNV